MESEESLSLSLAGERKSRPGGDEESNGWELSVLRDGRRRFARESLLLTFRSPEVGEGVKTLLREVLRFPFALVFGVVEAGQMGDEIVMLHVMIRSKTSQRREGHLLVTVGRCQLKCRLRSHKFAKFTPTTETRW